MLKFAYKLERAQLISCYIEPSYIKAWIKKRARVIQIFEVIQQMFTNKIKRWLVKLEIFKVYISCDQNKFKNSAGQMLRENIKNFVHISK